MLELFTGPPPEEVHLLRAPLVTVITQIKFPVITSVEQVGFIAAFQEAIRHKFPRFESNSFPNFVVKDNNIVPGVKNIWRFRNDSGHYTVSLASDFIALETTSYTSRTEFLSVWNFILNEVMKNIAPGSMDRIGLRYINRISAPEIDRIEDLVRLNMLGVSKTSIELDVKYAISEALIGADDDRSILVRWGRLAPKMIHDPSVLLPIDSVSWILDIDSFTEHRGIFNPDEARECADRLADAEYRFFRWSVTDEFLSTYGGEI